MSDTIMIHGDASAAAGRAVAALAIATPISAATTVAAESVPVIKLLLPFQGPAAADAVTKVRDLQAALARNKCSSKRTSAGSISARACAGGRHDSGGAASGAERGTNCCRRKGDPAREPAAEA